MVSVGRVDQDTACRIREGRVGTTIVWILCLSVTLQCHSYGITAGPTMLAEFLRDFFFAPRCEDSHGFVWATELISNRLVGEHHQNCCVRRGKKNLGAKKNSESKRISKIDQKTASFVGSAVFRFLSAKIPSKVICT